MRNRIAATVGIAVLIAASVIFATAQSGPGQEGPQPRQPWNGQGPPPPPPPPPPFGVPRLEQLVRDLNLTDQQASELKPFLETERTTYEALMKKMNEAHKQMKAATADGQFDEGRVRALANEQAKTFADMLVEQERVKSKIYNVLTPEQRQELARHKERRGPRPGGPEGIGGPPPPPQPPDN